MKLPNTNTYSKHKTGSLNSMTLSGISVLWAVMLNLISPWWLIAAGFCIISGYGTEIEPRNISI